MGLIRATEQAHEHRHDSPHGCATAHGRQSGGRREQAVLRDAVGQLAVTAFSDTRRVEQMRWHVAGTTIRRSDFSRTGGRPTSSYSSTNRRVRRHDPRGYLSHGQPTEGRIFLARPPQLMLYRARLANGVVPVTGVARMVCRAIAADRSP